MLTCSLSHAAPLHAQQAHAGACRRWCVSATCAADSLCFVAVAEGDALFQPGLQPLMQQLRRQLLPSRARLAGPVSPERLAASKRQAGPYAVSCSPVNCDVKLRFGHHPGFGEECQPSLNAMAELFVSRPSVSGAPTPNHSSGSFLRLVVACTSIRSRHSVAMCGKTWPRATWCSTIMWCPIAILPPVLSSALKTSQQAQGQVK